MFNLRYLKFFLFLFYYFAFSYHSNAQYHLDETGFRLGVGTNMSMPSNDLKPSFGFNANLFYSHWICGKGFGYHLEGGLRGNYLREQTYEGPSLLYKDKGFLTLYSFYNLDGGAFIKLRSENFHQDRETAWHLGVKFNYALATQAAHAGQKGFNINSDSYRQVNAFTIGAHVSAWFRFPTKGKSNNVWFINPGIEYYPTPSIKNPTQAARNMYIFINYARTFWNNR